MKTLEQLKQLYEEYSQGVNDWKMVDSITLDHLLLDARSRNGAVALDILARIPFNRFTDEQLRAFFSSLIFWIQGPSLYYDRALEMLRKYGKSFLPFLKESLRDAVQEDDDSLVQGLCHVFSLLDMDVQRSLRSEVSQELLKAGSNVKEVLQNLVERCRAFGESKWEGVSPII